MKISGLWGRLMHCLAFEEESRGRRVSESETLIDD
jgi:cell fate regulator YaaT (PSP1 superfamily)